MMRAAVCYPRQDIQMSFRVTRTLRASLALLASLTVAFAAHAGAASGDAPAPKPAAKAKKSLLLSRDELRACMSNQARLHQQREEVTQLLAGLTAEKNEIVRSGAELKERLAVLDRNNIEVVTKYAEDATAREKRIDAYDASSAAYNEKAQALEAASAAYKKDCENKRFDEADELAIKQGK
jgi:hypothetical protein